MVARPFFSEIHSFFFLQILVRKLQLLPAILVRNYFFSESISSIVALGIVVVVVVAVVTIGRRAKKKNYIYPPCGQQFHNENNPFFLSFPLWWLEKSILFSASPSVFLPFSLFN